MKLHLSQPLMKASKFERGEQTANRFVVPGFEPKLCRIQMQLHIIEQATQFLVDSHLFGVLRDRLAQFWRKLAGVSDDLLYVAVLIDQLRRGLVSHPWHPWQVIGTFAFKRDEVGPFFR